MAVAPTRMYVKAAVYDGNTSIYGCSASVYGGTAAVYGCNPAFSGESPDISVVTSQPNLHYRSSCDGVLSAYATATECPVLTPRVVVPGLFFDAGELRYRPTRLLRDVRCYAMSDSAATRCPDPYAVPGTDLVYAAMNPRACYAMSGTDLGYAATSRHNNFKTSVNAVIALGRILGTLSAYAIPTRCPVLTWRMVLSSYEPAMRCPVLTSRMVLPGGEDWTLMLHVSSYALAMPCPEARKAPPYCTVLAPICLRAPYAMSSTEQAYGTSFPRRFPVVS
eukprot:2448873-Rhodomonas_salina.2